LLKRGSAIAAAAVVAMTLLEAVRQWRWSWPGDEVLQPVSGKVGPFGGTVRLANGVSFVVPAGVTLQREEIRIVPVEVPPQREDMRSYVMLGCAFEIDNPLGEPYRPYRIVVPWSRIPVGASLSDVRLAASAWGLTDGPDGGGEDYLTTALSPNWISPHGLVFRKRHVGGLYQPVLYSEEKALAAAAADRARRTVVTPSTPQEVSPGAGGDR